MTTSSPETLPLEPRRDPKSWSFWRVRLARALVVGGFALAASRFLPALPHEQQLLFVAPAGVTIRSLDLVWRHDADGAAIGGVTLNPSDPASRLSHRISVPHGQYTFEITARMNSTCTSPPCEPNAGGEPAPGTHQERTVLLQRTVELAGDTAQVMLTER